MWGWPVLCGDETKVVALTPEERNQLYKMLGLKVIAYPDKSLEVSGAIVGLGGDGGRWPDGRDPSETAPSGGLGALELTRTCESQNTQSIELRFRATLRKEPKVELAIV